MSCSEFKPDAIYLGGRMNFNGNNTSEKSLRAKGMRHNFNEYMMRFRSESVFELNRIVFICAPYSGERCHLQDMEAH